MGFKELLKNVLDGEDENEVEETSAKTPETNKDKNNEPEQKKVEHTMNTNQTTTTKATVEKAKMHSALELKVVRPESFAAVGQIADHLLNGRTVVLNLEATSKEQSRRIVDFLNGVAYSIEGDIKLVSANTYIITPNSVNMSGEAINDATSSEDDTSVATEAPSFSNF
jgi:cell division inhibitor SepF